MKPTIGRIVRFHHGEQEDGPAIITHVWHEGSDGRPAMVNLVVFGTDYDNPAVTKTSVLEGMNPGNWSWPELV